MIEKNSRTTPKFTECLLTFLNYSDLCDIIESEKDTEIHIRYGTLKWKKK